MVPAEGGPSIVKPPTSEGEVRATPADPMKVRAMPPCATGGGGGVLGPHAHGGVGRRVADEQDNARRG